MKDININIFDDCNKLLFHQSNSNGRHVSSTLLNPLETVRTLFKQHGMRLDSTEGSFDTGKKTVFRHYPYNKVSIVFVILDWEKGRAPADEKACKGLIEVVYYLLIMFGGQDTDFCTSDQVKSLKIGEVFREVRGIVGHLLDSFPDLDGAPLSLVTQAPRVARLSRPVGSKFKSFFQSCEGQDDIVAAAVFNGSTTLAMSHSYRAQSGMSGVLLRFALPLALSQQPLATMRDMPFFGLPEGQLRASTLLLKDDVRLVLITQVDGPSVEELAAILQKRGLLAQLAAAVEGYLTCSGFEAKQVFALPREVREACVTYLPSVDEMYLEKDGGGEDWWTCGRRDHVDVGDDETRSHGARMPYFTFRAEGVQDCHGALYATALSHVADLLTLPVPAHFGSPVSLTSGHLMSRDGLLCLWSAEQETAAAWGPGAPPTRITLTLFQRSASANVSAATKRHNEVLATLAKHKKALRDTLS